MNLKMKVSNPHKKKIWTHKSESLTNSLVHAYSMDANKITHMASQIERLSRFGSTKMVFTSTKVHSVLMSTTPFNAL